MNNGIKIAILGLTFVTTFLLWPGFGVRIDYDCESIPAEIIARGGECDIVDRVEYTDAQLGGGWRWINERNCIVDGTLYLATSGRCPAQMERVRIEQPTFLFLGPLLITGALGVALFKPWKRISKTSKKQAHKK